MNGLRIGEGVSGVMVAEVGEDAESGASEGGVGVLRGKQAGGICIGVLRGCETAASFLPEGVVLAGELGLSNSWKKDSSRR